MAPVDPPHRLHIRSGSASGTHIRGDPAFFRDVAEALGATEAVLLVGPSTAKSELVAYLQRHLPLVGARVVGVETLARVTDHQLLAEGRRYFRKADLMTPQTS